MKHPISIKAISILIHIAVVLIATAFVLYLQDWFGSGDTYAFLFWTVPFAAGIASSGSIILNFYKQASTLLWSILLIISAVFLAVIWVLCVSLVLGPWTGAFSIPVFYLWIFGALAQLLFLKRLPVPGRRGLKLLYFPLTVIATTVSMYILAIGGSYFMAPDKKTYLIPEGFSGKVRVIYGEKCGVDPVYEDGRMMLRIPENGILIIQPEFEAGTIDHEYYFVSPNENRRKIDAFYDYEDLKKGRRGVLLGGSGSIADSMQNGGFSTESPSAIDFTDLTVHSGDSVLGDDEHAEFRAGQSFDSLTQILVDQCRVKVQSSPAK